MRSYFHRSLLQQSFKLFNREPSIPDDAAHGVLIHWVVAWNCYDSNAIAHHRVLALTENTEADFLKCAHSTKMIDSRKFRHN